IYVIGKKLGPAVLTLLVREWGEPDFFNRISAVSIDEHDLHLLTGDKVAIRTNIAQRDPVTRSVHGISFL
ncbi:hypothetical protein, partial [Pseudomonas viridiflava]|uniref:hypothetical protein n=1 Tax=Pseudomonas viridiflava TaxID=33069 RepID=UPI0019D2977D